MRDILWDLVVVGAGPVGCLAAETAAGKDLSVLLLEDHQEIGEPVQGAGLISKNGLEELNVKLNSNFVLNRVQGAHFYSPNGNYFEIDAHQTKAFVVERKVFDKDLAKRAASAGAKILVKTRARSFSRNNGILNVLTHSYGEPIRFQSKLLIGADGVRSNIAKLAGLKQIDFEEVLVGLEYDVSNIEVDPNFVELYFGIKVAPGFFAWIIPKGENLAQVGLAINDRNISAYIYLKNFMEKHPIASKKLKNAQMVEINSGLIPICGPIPKTVTDNIMVVGDAAGNTKATTGGGIVTGGLCARIAAEVAAKAVKANDFSAKILSQYENQWRQSIGKELEIGYWIRKLANKLSDSQLDSLFEFFSKDDLANLIVEKGDMDKPFALTKELLKRAPSLIKIIGKSSLKDLWGRIHE
ncbi:MAG: NAD(P)/FAD-dependent oxidoreductase [Euryarchaeota archaeon]|nr:NAD(P)/FAD-dependent oxidoreductase [Euryarchaeota archaeon]